MLSLYNSLTKKKEPFTPLTSKSAKIYVCGITPYDTTHLGHAFTYMAFDALIRYLLFKGYHIEYVQNVTDIDDDILKKAAKEQKNWQKLGNFWTKKFLNDLTTLNILPPTHYVKATESMDTIIKMTLQLLRKNLAYKNKGNVYFRVKSFPEYGKLSKLSTQQMVYLSKERGANPDDPAKEYALDFILWQKSRPQEPSWQSPMGKGRPGWHIECSAMNYDYLGEQIDIHGGGHDLIFPHHESEIAQSESFTGKKKFANYWMHTAMLMYQGEKMSKSLGNLIMVSDLIKKFSPNAIRYILLSHHYRKPWDFEEDELEEAEKTISNIKIMVEKIKGTPKNQKSKLILKRFSELMEDDLNTPEALKLMKKLSSKITKDNNESSLLALGVIYDTLGFTR